MDKILFDAPARELNTIRKNRALAKRRIEIGEVETTLGRVMVAHDIENDAISIHGTVAALSEIQTGLRAAFVSSAAAFAEAEDAEQQLAAHTLVALVVDAVLRRHEFLGAKVRERL